MAPLALHARSMDGSASAPHWLALRSALAKPHDVHRFLRLHTPCGPNVLVAETLDGVEQIDGIGFQWTITALSLDASLALAPLIGQGALLQLQQADGSVRARPGRITGGVSLASSRGVGV